MRASRRLDDRIAAASAYGAKSADVVALDQAYRMRRQIQPPMRPNARANAPSTSPRPQMMLPTLAAPWTMPRSSATGLDGGNEIGGAARTIEGSE